MPFSFSKKTVAGFLVAMSLLVFLSAVSYQTIASLELADNWVGHTLQVMAATQRLSAELTEAHYSKQLYALTHNDALLNDYNRAKPPIRRDLDSLKWLVRDNPPQVQKVKELTGYANIE